MKSMIYSGWKNKVGTADRACKCGSWKNHWIKFSGKEWPAKCSVVGCNNSATVGAHVYNKNVSGEKLFQHVIAATKERVSSHSSTGLR